MRLREAAREAHTMRGISRQTAAEAAEIKVAIDRNRFASMEALQ